MLTARRNKRCLHLYTVSILLYASTMLADGEDGEAMKSYLTSSSKPQLVQDTSSRAVRH